MKPIRLLLLPLFVLVGSPALMGGEKKEGPGAEDLAVSPGERLELMNCGAQELAAFYARYSGKLVGVSAEAGALRTSLVVDGPLTNGDAARFVENQLLLEGFVLKEAGPGDLRIVKGGGPWRMPANRKKHQGARRRPRPDAVCVPEGRSFEWLNIDLSTCSHLLRMHAGSRILIAPGISTLELKVHADGPLTNADVVGLLENALLAKGVFLKEFAPAELVMFPINRSIVEDEASAKETRIPRVQRMPTLRRAVPEEP